MNYRTVLFIINDIKLFSILHRQQQRTTSDDEPAALLRSSGALHWQFESNELHKPIQWSNRDGFSNPQQQDTQRTLLRRWRSKHCTLNWYVQLISGDPNPSIFCLPTTKTHCWLRAKKGMISTQNNHKDDWVVICVVVVRVVSHRHLGYDWRRNQKERRSENVIQKLMHVDQRIR